MRLLELVEGLGAALAAQAQRIGLVEQEEEGAVVLGELCLQLRLGQQKPSPLALGVPAVLLGQAALGETVRQEGTAHLVPI